MTDLIVRDRNHPSIFMWSIGNEVLEQWTDAKADTLSLAEANLVLNFGHSADLLAKDGEMSVNSLLTKKLADMVRKLDATRPVKMCIRDMARCALLTMWGPVVCS